MTLLAALAALEHKWAMDEGTYPAEMDERAKFAQAAVRLCRQELAALRVRFEGAEPMLRPKTRDDLGLAITMLDADRLREWADKFNTYGNDISNWGDRRFVIEQLRAVAGRIEDTVREVGTLRELAGISPPGPDPEPVKETR